MARRSDTLCLEKNHYTGGMAATVELFEGFRFEIAGSVLFPLPAQIYDDLGLDACPTVDTEVMSVNLGDPGVVLVEPAESAASPRRRPGDVHAAPGHEAAQIECLPIGCCSDDEQQRSRAAVHRAVIVLLRMEKRQS